MKNKTTIIGIVTAFFAFIVFDNGTWSPQWLESLAVFAAAGGLAALGIFGKDADVTHSPSGSKNTEKTVS